MLVCNQLVIGNEKQLFDRKKKNHLATINTGMTSFQPHK